MCLPRLSPSSIVANSRWLLLCVMALFLVGCEAPLGLGAKPQDISANFSHTRQLRKTVNPSQVFSGEQVLPFQPLVLPANLASSRYGNWLRTTLKPADTARILELPSLLVTHAKIWYRLADGSTVSYASGLAVPVSERAIRHGGLAFPVPDGKGEEIQVLLGIATNSTYYFSAMLWNERDWLTHSYHSLAWYGLLFGGLTVLILYNFFFALSLRDSTYLYYVGYEIFMFLTILVYSGLSKEYLPWIKPKPDIIFISAMGAFFGVLFVNRFLNVRSWYPRLWLLIQANVIYGVLSGLSYYIPVGSLPFLRRTEILHISLLLSASYYLLISLYFYVRGLKQARFLALAMVVLVSAMLLHFLYLYGWLKYNVLLHHVLEAGILAEGILMSLALSDKIKILAEEKRRLDVQYLHVQQAFTLELVEIEEAEKKRYASILHDSVGHGLLVLKQRLEKFRHELPSKALVDEVRGMSNYCHEVMNEVRNLSHELHPHILEKLGLRAALVSVLDRAFSALDILWVDDIDANLPALPADIQIALYRIVQEATANILKHAQASEVLLRLRLQEEMICLEIKDDGVGIEAGKSKEGLGLKMMKAHTQLLSGDLEVESRAGVGTLLRVRMPLQES